MRSLTQDIAFFYYFLYDTGAYNKANLTKLGVYGKIYLYLGSC